MPREFCAIFALLKPRTMLNIAVAAGGDSGEYRVSLASAGQVVKHADRSRFMPWLVVIRQDLWVCHHEGAEIPVDRSDFSVEVGGKKIRFDAVFNAIHGTPGENGKLQGYLDLLGVPYTSCDLVTSALTFNKAFCKAVVASFGVSTARYAHLFRQDALEFREALSGLSFPVFVKPNNGGSSVGMSRVNEPGFLKKAMEKAFREDHEILVEEFIQGRELTCGVLRTRDEVIAFPVTEIISKKEFFDYEAKYTEGMAQEVVPAEIPGSVATHCRELSRKLYVKLNCKGVVRFDYIWDGALFWFLEVNTVPGMSEASIIPKMAIAHGWTFTELVTRLIEECL
jgi:D-alanine-D-alanine ligase